MSARAMWKGTICFADVRVPVKFYAAIADRSIHFRLLHAKDRVPVKQALVKPETDEVVPYAEAGRAYVTPEHEWVRLAPEELEAVEPAPSRDIEILQFLPPEAIDHRWYLRPYYLGPDGADKAYAAFVAALEKTGLEGLARWTMRNQTYIGALRLHAGVVAMVSLRHKDEVISVHELEAPRGRELDKRELDMASQLIGMMAAPFEPAQNQNEHRARILKLIDTKRHGGRVNVIPFRRPKPTDNLAAALEASLKQERKRA